MTNDPYGNRPHSYGGQSELGPRPAYGQQPPNPFQQQPHGSPYQQPYQQPYQSGPQQWGHGNLPAQYGYGHQMDPVMQRAQRMQKLNSWLSVFFPIASVIFFAVEKGKSPLYDQHLRETLNMGLTRMLLGIGLSIFDGGVIAGVLGLATFVYFILAIVGTIQSNKELDQGREAKFPGAIPFTRP